MFAIVFSFKPERLFPALHPQCAARRVSLDA
jgi:hypothetical protein